MRDIASTQPGVRVAPSFADLGVDQCATAKPDLEKRTQRGEDSLDKLARISLLPLPMKLKAQVAAASATAGGSYAAAANPVPRGDIFRLRDSTFKAAWKSTYRCKVG